MERIYFNLLIHLIHPTRRGKMSVESKIRKNKKSRRDVILTLSVTSVFKSFIVQLF